MDIDTWRRSEAEARQQMQTRTCSNCGDTMNDCDAWECPECHQYFCVECITGMPGHRICGECMEKEEAFNEVEEIENDCRPWFRKQEEKREAAMMKAEEERGK